MNVIKTTLFLAFLLPGIYAFAQDNQARVFSLQDCIDYAVEHNPSLKIARLERNISSTQVGETRAEGFPQISADMRLSHNFEPQKMRIDPSQFFGGDSTNGN